MVLFVVDYTFCSFAYCVSCVCVCVSEWTARSYRNDDDNRSKVERERDRQEQHRRVYLAIDYGLLSIIKRSNDPMVICLSTITTIGQLFHLCVFHQVGRAAHICSRIAD